MNDFDDPIEDLLSEGDSFFEDPKLLAKKTTPKKTSKAVADIFGLDTDVKPTSKPTNKENDWLGIQISKEDKQIVKDKPADIKSKKLESKISFEKDDVNNLLELTSAEPRTVAAKKSSILTDILGETKQDEKPFSFDDILQSSSLRKKETTPVTSEAKSTPQPSKEFTPILGREPRRTRRNSPNIIDPLGIFETQKAEPLKKDEHKKIDTIKTETKTADLPNWLGGSTEKPKPEPEKQTEAKKPILVEPEPKTQTPTATIPDHMLESLLTQQKISSSHIELQNTSLALQQQESQLIVAVQLKKYEDNLAEMQRKQQEMLLKQDIQFNTLLQRQFSKQEVMENNMRLQQERINHHIQLLLSQPTTGLAVGENMSETQKTKNNYIKTTFEENKKFYDDILTSLKQKHQEEIFLLEESYKKQLTFLENSLESTETRLKNEIESINKFFTEKINDLSKEKQEIIQKYEERIKKITDENLSEIETIKENNKITIGDVRNEYKQMIDDIVSTKTKEHETFAGAQTITKKIDESLEVLQDSTKLINNIQNKFNNEEKLISDFRQESLNARETEIKMMQTSLEKQRSINDGERAQLLALVRTLETRLAEQTQATREERWALQQTTATLSARAQALDRETDFVRKNLDREREQIQTLKQTLLTEHEKTILQLNEEKLTIAAEKSRLETSAKLNQNFDSTRAKAEVEAAIKIAKEATELTDKERELLCQQQCEIEVLKRNLQDREIKLTAKEQELEKLFKIADLKYSDGEKSLQEAKLTEHKYTERLKDIQKQMISLASREKKLTEEKIALSKDRLTLHNQLKDNKKCGLCEVDKYKNDFNEYKPNTNAAPVWGTDAEILRLKYDLENDNVVSREQSVIENDLTPS